MWYDFIFKYTTSLILHPKNTSGTSKINTFLCIKSCISYWYNEKCNSYIYLRQHIFQVTARHPGVVIMPRPTYLYDGWINKSQDLTHPTEPLGTDLFIETRKIYPCILYHWSMLRWHMPLKSFLVECKDAFILHGCHWLRNIRRQGIHSMGIDLTTQNNLASAPEGWKDINQEFQNDWNNAPHYYENEWQRFTTWLFESRSMRTCYFVLVINIQVHGIQFNILIF